jgi:hypothetical protein
MKEKMFEFHHKHHNWEIAARHIATARADYYAQVDGVEKGSKEWEEEYTYSLNDDSVLREWYYNNMDFEDIEKYAIKLDRYPCEEDDK